MKHRFAVPSILALATLAVFAAGCASGGRGAELVAEGWTPLGTVTAHGRVDRDQIEVGAGRGTFRSLKFLVNGSAVDLFDIRVVFANGDVHSPETRLTFGRGTESRVLDLPGDARAIRHVVVRYGNLPRGGKAHLRLFGK